MVFGFVAVDVLYFTIRFLADPVRLEKNKSDPEVIIFNNNLWPKTFVKLESLHNLDSIIFFICPCNWNVEQITFTLRTGFLFFYPIQVDLVDPDLFIVSSVSVCRSDLNSIWQIMLYAIKGIVLIFGVFLAWQTRKVTIPALNDSKFIGKCVRSLSFCVPFPLKKYTRSLKMNFSPFFK